MRDTTVFSLLLIATLAIIIIFLNTEDGCLFIGQLFWKALDLVP